MSLAKYEPYNKLKKIYGVSRKSFRSWEERNLVQTIKTPGQQRLYKVEDIEKVFSIKPKVSQRQSYIYARVSSSHQRKDLTRQIEILQKAYPFHIVIKDIGSGLNWERKGFKTLLEHVHNSRVEEVVVLWKDRLCRFGFQMLEYFFDKFGTVIKVYGQGEESQTPTQELSDDLFAIVNFFVAKNNGQRAGKNKKRKRELENRDNQREIATADGNTDSQVRSTEGKDESS